MMSSVDVLVKEAQGLPEDLIMNAVAYLRFLKFKLELESTKPQAPLEEKKKRRAGILKGILTIPASFDDPLDDFEDYM